MIDRVAGRRISVAMAVIAFVLMPPAFLHGQGRGRGQAAPPVPRATAPVDLTGYWVSVVTEDWRFRMVTPLKGDYQSVPLNPEGKRVADLWDPAKDEASGEQCRAYGAPAIMRAPGRVHITWENDNTLRVDTDAGTQSRLFHFQQPTLITLSNGGAPQIVATPSQGDPTSAVPRGEPTWQGNSIAEWEYATDAAGALLLPAKGPTPATATPTGDLKVVTTHLRPGYLRKNGVPYSGNATLTEYFTRTNEDNGDSWLVVITMVDDPQYLRTRFVTSTHFKKQADASGWNPTPCEAR